MLTNFHSQFPNFTVIFLAQSGSKLYGTNRPSSDDDIRGICVPSADYVFGLRKSFECFEDPTCDTKIHSLKKTFHLLLDGDPQMTELLWAPEDKIVSMTPAGKLVRDNRHRFVSMKIVNRIVGYSYSEYRKALAQKVEFSPLPPKEDELRCGVVDYMRIHGADKEATDNILGMFDQFRERKIVPSVSNLGAKRKADVDKYGYCTSSMAHSIRLLGQLHELLTTGNIVFPRHNASFLRDIRNGLVPVEVASSEYEKALSLVNEAKTKNTMLSDKPNYQFVEELYRHILQTQTFSEISA